MGTLFTNKTRFKTDTYLSKYLFYGSKNEILLDLDEDKIPDIALIDDDNDGDLDTIAVDLTGDGEFNLYLIDLNKNGIADAVVYQASGEKDPELFGIGEEIEKKMIDLAEQAFIQIVAEEYEAEKLKNKLIEIENQAKEARKNIR